MPNPFTYSAYGLTINSDVGLPGFVEIESGEGLRFDVEIRHGRITASLLDEYFGSSEIQSAPDCDVRVSNRAMWFSYRQSADILVADGDKVLLDVRPGTQDAELIPYLTGYVIAVLLHQRKCLVLHASVVAVGEVAVAFLGAKGHGKSTIAASLESRGNRLISDDMLPIVSDNGRVSTMPGYPRIRLFEDSANAVGANPSQMTALGHNTAKLSLACNEFSNRPIQLAAVYVLNIDDDISIEPISSVAAFIEATKHTNVGFYLQESDSQDWHFEKCRELVNNVPFFRLTRPHDFVKIQAVNEALTKHIDAIKCEPLST